MGESAYRAILHVSTGGKFRYHGKVSGHSRVKDDLTITEVRGKCLFRRVEYNSRTVDLGFVLFEHLYHLYLTNFCICFVLFVLFS